MNKKKLLELAVLQVKNYFFHEGRRFLCHTNFCPELDGFCPRYDCGLLDRFKRFTDRQWANAIKPYLGEYFPNDIGSIDSVTECAANDLMLRRPRGKNE
jgi:hypothetical protein